MTLTRSETVLDLDGDYDGQVRFACDPIAILLDAARWVDMGKPEQVTVTIEAGDRLNT